MIDIFDPVRRAWPHIDGAYKTGVGFVYLVIAAKGCVKVGSTQNPRPRLMDGVIRRDGLAVSYNGLFYSKPTEHYRITRLILCNKEASFRDIEKRLHAILAPFRAGSMREHYLLPQDILEELIQTFVGELNDEAIAHLSEAVNYALQIKEAA
jgi:hypothetical protein